MQPIHKTFEIQVLEGSDNGGRILINTGALDRDRDRVLPSGMKVDNYTRNPVVQWGHNYRDPWATVGKTTWMDVTADGVVAEFVLRPAANDQDPQNIVRLLWAGGWVRTASIGFIPTKGKQNPEGGMDFSEWELLEWSLVPIPANQDALRLAVKGIDALPAESSELPMPESSTEALATKEDNGVPPRRTQAPPEPGYAHERARGNDAIEKRGRVLSSKNEARIKSAVEALQAVLSELEQQTETADDGDKSAQLMTVSGADGFPPEARGNDDDAVEKGAIPPHTTPMADEDTPWDGPAVVAELPNERAVLRRVHAWVDDEGDPDVKNSYKFPHHLADGRVVLRGVNNAMARLSQATIPDGDRDGVERHLRRHQEQFNKETNTSTPGERPDGSVLAGEDEAETAAAAERELAEVLGQYLKTLKEVLT
jgi:hypothetical protein